jgi:glycosyltransferase involved in cell wall biosynthesis
MEDHVRIVGSLKPPYAALKKEARAVDWLAELYQTAAVYVSAGIAEGAEGLSLAMLDAMAAGSPIVATRISGNRDVIRDGETGLLVPPNQAEALANAISQILQSETLSNRLAENAADFADRMSWIKIAGKYINLYKKLVGQ